MSYCAAFTRVPFDIDTTSMGNPMSLANFNAYWRIKPDITRMVQVVMNLLFKKKVIAQNPKQQQK